MIDFRSDTVTQPTEAMLQAMMSAKVGDDVFGDDPTVIALEEMTAAMFGKEAALFCASGTMTNQIAIKVHTRPGDEVICAEDSHIYKYEGGGMAFNSSVQARVLQADRGRIKAHQILPVINADDVHFPRTSLVSLENTHNRGGGSIYDLHDIADIRKVCDTHGLPLHIDGARIFNALVATDTKPAELGKYFDSVSVCLSKGLGCPVGSLLLGSKDFIKQSRRIRKVFGGGWRQAGYLAAAGIYALNHNIHRLKEDHERAKSLGEFIATLPYIDYVLPVQTNIVIFFLKPERTADDMVDHLSKSDIRVVKTGPQSIRFVTHLQTSDNMVQAVCEVMQAFH